MTVEIAIKDLEDNHVYKVKNLAHGAAAIHSGLQLKEIAKTVGWDSSKTLQVLSTTKKDNETMSTVTEFELELREPRCFPDIVVCKAEDADRILSKIQELYPDRGYVKAVYAHDMGALVLKKQLTQGDITFA